MLSVRAIQAPTRAVRSEEWGVSPLSGGRARPGPGPRGRPGGASSPGSVLTASGGRRCASPRGPAQGCSSARAAPRGALSASARSRAASAPLAGPSCSLSLLLPLARPPARGLQPPGSLWGGGVVSSGVARTCGGPGSSPGMHRPPQVAKSGGENAPAPPPPAPSPGCWGRGRRRAAAAAAAAEGGGASDAALGASAPRETRSGWRRANVGTGRRTVHRTCELPSCSRGGARRALTRPWPRAARGGSRGLSLAPPGARRRLASPQARVPRAAPRPAGGGPGSSSPPPAGSAQPLRGAAGPAVLPAAPLRPD